MIYMYVHLLNESEIQKKQSIRTDFDSCIYYWEHEREDAVCKRIGKRQRTPPHLPVRPTQRRHDPRLRDTDRLMYACPECYRLIHWRRFGQDGRCTQCRRLVGKGVKRRRNKHAARRREADVTQ